MAHLRRLEQLAGTAPIAIVSVDERRRVRYCNRAFEKLFLRRAAELRGKPLDQLVGSARDRKATAEIRRAEKLLSRVTRTFIGADERVRSRVARTLHDDIAQRLALWQINIDRFQHGVKARSRQIARALKTFRDDAAAITDTVRALSIEVDPTSLTVLSLTDALHHLCTDMEERFGVPIRFTSRAVPTPIPPAIAQCLYRILDDALRMTTTCEGKRCTSVTLRGTDSGIHLRVNDFGGRRFVHRMPPIARELHVVVMRERAAAVRGTFLLTRGPNGTARIDVDVPL